MNALFSIHLPFSSSSDNDCFFNWVAAIWLGIGATLPIDISLTLGLF
jgi:hypothetical protein